MNIFYLDHDPKVAASYLCDKHLSSLILELAQNMSINHRILDGKEVVTSKVVNGKVKNSKSWIHPDENLNKLLYKSSRMFNNHTSVKWTRESIENYNWTYNNFIGVCNEYTERYGRIHSTEKKLAEILKNPPKNIPKVPFTKIKYAFKKFPQFHLEDPVESYRMYYMSKQSQFKMRWNKKIEPPPWFIRTDEAL